MPRGREKNDHIFEPIIVNVPELSSKFWPERHFRVRTAAKALVKISYVNAPFARLLVKAELPHIPTTLMVRPPIRAVTSREIIAKLGGGHQAQITLHELWHFLYWAGSLDAYVAYVGGHRIDIQWAEGGWNIRAQPKEYFLDQKIGACRIVARYSREFLEG